MACTTINLTGIDYACDDLGIGGIVELHVSTRTNAITAIGLNNYDESTRVIASGNPAAPGPYFLVACRTCDPGYSCRCRYFVHKAGP